MLKSIIASTANSFVARFREAIESDKVRPFVWEYYLVLWAWGVVGTFFLAPIPFLLPVMGLGLYDLWVWSHLGATTLVLAGLKLQDKAYPGDPEEYRAPSPLFYWAMGMQASGHMCMFWVLFSYEVAGIMDLHRNGPGHIYSMFALSAYVMGCCLLAIQCMVKIFG